MRKLTRHHPQESNPRYIPPELAEVGVQELHQRPRVMDDKKHITRRLPAQEAYATAERLEINPANSITTMLLDIDSLTGAPGMQSCEPEKGRVLPCRRRSPRLRHSRHARSRLPDAMTSRLAAVLGVHYMHYSFCHIHKTLGMTPIDGCYVGAAMFAPAPGWRDPWKRW